MWGRVHPETFPLNTARVVQGPGRPVQAKQAQAASEPKQTVSRQPDNQENDVQTAQNQMHQAPRNSHTRRGGDCKAYCVTSAAEPTTDL